jgi:response regulator RpfG family c-di-GMP phosphodiesterase
VLLVDDEPDISEIINLIIEPEFNLNCDTAENGKNAIEKIKANGNYDLIISDFNMPEGNGRFLFEYLVRNQISIPFILVTTDDWDEHSEFHRGESVGYVQKPFDEKQVIESVAKYLLRESSNMNSSAGSPEYIRVSIATLMKVRRIEVPLHVKLSPTKYVVLHNSGFIFDEVEFLKLKNKGAEWLYVLRSDYKALAQNYSRDFLAQFFFKTIQGDLGNGFTVLAATQEIIKKAVLTFGFSKDAISLAEDSIRFVKAVTDRNPNLNVLLRWINNNEYRYEYVHATLICFFVAAIAKVHEFKTKNAVEKLALAAYFHDVSLEIYLMENEISFREAIKIGSKINRLDLENVRQHPVKSASMMREWSQFPGESIEIITRHCELPDGRGFPNQLKGNNIDELSSCFILCEDVVNRFLQNRNKASTIEYLKTQTGFYNCGFFSNFHKIILGIFEIPIIES